MDYWWCNQKDGWDVEYGAGVVRSSGLAKNTTFRRTVGDARAGDVIVHYRRPHVVAFSRAREDGRAVTRLPDGYDHGWEFRTEYLVLSSPIHRDSFRHQIEVPPLRGFALNASAKVNQGYFFRFNIEGVSLLLSHVSPTDRLAAWLEQIRSAGESDADDVATRLAEPARFSAHRRRERNPQLASAAKRIHGYACQVCHFDFSQAYGDIGIGYIEAHHVVPLSQLDPAEEVVLSPEDDFAVVCANCHRMLHRKPYPSVEKLREAVEARRSK